MHCLVIGATGYIGSQLVPRLLGAGHTVRVLVRDGSRLAAQSWAAEVSGHIGDVADPAITAAACRGAGAVFHLVHSMDGPGFAARDRAAAVAVAAAARDAGVRRIVYLSGLQPEGDVNSAHLASRREVGELLLASGVPTSVVQAGMVVGAGSASFALVSELAALAPVLPLPDHAWNLTQPVGIDDVLHHLLACLDLPPQTSGAFDIGGPDVLTYGGLVTGYAAVAGLTRPVVVPVPISTPRLTARAAAALTSVDRHLAAPLLESLAHDTVCRTPAPTAPPPDGPTPYAEAVRRALPDPAGPGVGVVEHRERLEVPRSVLWEALVEVGAGRCSPCTTCWAGPGWRGWRRAQCCG